ncbi:MAG TPA: glutathione S-transferase N-terminal domain-containing protein [Myxococcota bacterium]|nr:glutathione S-transferase N-terminal domain-containing protein [Myxococcota bacterium]
MDTLLRIVGAPGSPYSRKLRAVLRYRRIPHAWVQAGSAGARALPRPRVELLPQLVYPDAKEALTDSSPLIRRLERERTGRSVIPDDPVLAFLDLLLEDYADEWLTKPMFHYRWAYAADAAQAAAILPRWRRIDDDEENARVAAKTFAERQIGRLGVVGSNATTAPLIEASYRRLLERLDARLREAPFVFGARPSAADFALYGQLTQLAGFDPTPRALALELAPRVVAWLDLVEDLSGLEPRERDWIAREAVTPALRALFAELGRVYAPFLLANADALARSVERVECTIDGARWVQRPFAYQGKCLQWLREAYAALAPGDRAALDGVLAGSGCAALWS